jgi:hypothetical protein
MRASYASPAIDTTNLLQDRPTRDQRGSDGSFFPSLLAAQHVLEMVRRALPNGTSRRRLDRLSNRLTKILIEARKLATP